MGRMLKSPTRSITNRGDLPRFMGEFPCTKATSRSLVFDSISALYCGVYLEWRPDVVHLAFEPRKHTFNAVDDLPRLHCIPDYEAILNTDECELYEAKCSDLDMSARDSAKLALTAAHFRKNGRKYRVVYRRRLETNGFIDTVLLLRRYGLLPLSEPTLRIAMERLAAQPKTNLAGWRSRAKQSAVPIGVLYHLLYHKKLPLAYQRLLPVELLACRD